ASTLGTSCSHTFITRGASHTSVFINRIIKRTAPLYCLKYWLVSEPFADSSGGGVPSKITLPPLFPPSGPISIIQSALEITSRLCSITITVLPPSTSRFKISRAGRLAGFRTPLKRSLVSSESGQGER